MMLISDTVLLKVYQGSDNTHRFFFLLPFILFLCDEVFNLLGFSHIDPFWVINVLVLTKLFELAFYS